MTTTQIIILIVVAVLIIAVVYFGLKKYVPSCDEYTYVGKAKLTYKFTDEAGCFICEFEKNGKKINAVYGFDKPGLKVGDEVDVVWNGMSCNLPHVMDKQVYDREMTINTHINANQGRGDF